MRNRETLTGRTWVCCSVMSRSTLSCSPQHRSTCEATTYFSCSTLWMRDTFDYAGAFDDILHANEPLVRARDLLEAGSAAAVKAVREQLNLAREHPFLQG